MRVSRMMTCIFNEGPYLLYTLDCKLIKNKNVFY